MGAMSLRELVSIQRSHGQLMPWEVGVFIALEVCESLRGNPVRVNDADVVIAEDGKIGLAFCPEVATTEESAAAVVEILNALLVASGTQVPDNLQRFSQRSTGPAGARSRWQLNPLRDELEASLVPLNRPATTRILSRLVRDAHALRSGQRAASPAEAAETSQHETEVDSQLDAMLMGLPARSTSSRGLLDPVGSQLGTSRDQTRPAEVRVLPSPPVDTSRSALQSAFGGPAAPVQSSTRVSPPPARPSQKSGPAVTSADNVDNPILEALQVGAQAGSQMELPVSRKKSNVGHDPALEKIVDLDRAAAATSEILRTHRKPASGELDRDGQAHGRTQTSSATVVRRLALGVCVFALCVGVALVWWNREGLLRFVASRPQGKARIDAAHSNRANHANHASAREHLYGDIVVRVQPERTQVLLYVGVAPAIASSLPVGLAHEFVVVMPGRQPRRSVVPPDATWERLGASYRYELAMELDELVQGSTLKLGETRLTERMGSPTGQLGDVRVITNPPGAAVYQLVGFAPEVRIQDVVRAKSYEFLFFHPSKDLHRVLIKPEKFVSRQGRWVADLDVRLP
jgi:hypothetical protein